MLKFKISWLLALYFTINFVVILLSPQHAFYTEDSGEYIELSKNLYEHGQFALWENNQLIPNFNRTLLYPLILAQFHIFGNLFTQAVAIFQTLLSCVVLYLVYKYSLNKWGAKTAFFSSILFALQMGVVS
jgi:4-amino-4-deoxy-L-arabinose transferase-like glycosyltransferase